MNKEDYYIIAYDIVETVRRTKVMNILKNFGERVQKSVFECTLDDITFKKMMQKLDDVIDKETDSVLACVLCKSCKKKRYSLGVRVFGVERSFRII